MAEGMQEERDREKREGKGREESEGPRRGNIEVLERTK